MGTDARGPSTESSPKTGRDDGAGQLRRVRWVFPSALLIPEVKAPHVIGRDDSCDTVLDGAQISRRHAEFRMDGPVLAVRDLGSRNGVQINGVILAEGRLALGDVIRCGEWIGVVVGDSDPGGLREIARGWFGGAGLASAVEAARRIARDDLPIVLEGDTGTGKEGVAHAIHAWGGRAGPFVAVNCTNLPDALAEAELFGYRRGAFTGAATWRRLDGQKVVPPACAGVRVVDCQTGTDNEDINDKGTKKIEKAAA